MINTGTDKSRNIFLCIWRWRREDLWRQVKGPVKQTSFLANLNAFSIHCHSLATPQRSQTKDTSITRTLDGRGNTPHQWLEDKTCNISVTCCFLWVGRCPSAMTPHPKETSWACTRLVRPLPPSPASGSLVDFERSLEQQLRKELNVKARNVFTQLEKHGWSLVVLRLSQISLLLSNCWTWITLSSISSSTSVRFCPHLASFTLEFVL